MRKYPKKAVEEAVKLDPFYTRAHFNLGNAYLRVGRREEGRRELRRFSELDGYDKKIQTLRHNLLRRPRDFELYHSLGVFYSKKGELERAASAYLRAIRINPNFAPSYNNLGNIYLKVGRYPEAEEMFLKAISSDSTYALAYCGLGSVFLMEGRIPEARDAYRRAMYYDPTSDDARYNLKIIDKLINLGRVR